MPQRKFFVATGIIVFDFELFIGGGSGLLCNAGTLFARSDQQDIYKMSLPSCGMWWTKYLRKNMIRWAERIIIDM